MSDTPVKAQHPSEPKRRHSTHTIEIKIEVPQFESVQKVKKQSLTTLQKLWQKRLFKLGLALMAVILTAALTVSILSNHTKNQTAANPIKNSDISEAEKKAQVPFFSTLLPAGKTIEALGGWQRASPSNSNASFAFSDLIGNNRIVVTQQPLPEDFKQDTEKQIDNLIGSTQSTEKITVNNLVVHIATSAKGPQSAIFAKSGLLVMIRSSVTLSNDEWIGYINSLQ